MRSMFITSLSKHISLKRRLCHAAQMTLVAVLQLVCLNIQQRKKEFLTSLQLSYLTTEFQDNYDKSAYWTSFRTRFF